MFKRRQSMFCRVPSQFVAALESRRLLSGNVQVSLSPSGNLVITGDAADNSIGINDDGTNITIQESGGGTVNGQSSVSIPTASVHKVSVNGNDGNDQIGIFGLGQTGPATGNLSIDGGSGDDAVFMFFSTISGTTEFEGGSGNDYYLDASSTHMKQATYEGGSGDDQIQLSDCTMNDTVSVDSGSGNDIVTLDNPNPEVGLYKKGVQVVTGAGADRVEVIFSKFQAGLSVETGIGNDVAFFNNTRISGNLRLNTGGGDDSISLLFNRFGGEVRVNGGSGNDSLTDDHNIFSGSKILKHLEIVNLV